MSATVCFEDVDSQSHCFSVYDRLADLQASRPMASQLIVTSWTCSCIIGYYAILQVAHISLKVQNQKLETLNGKFFLNISLNKFTHTFNLVLFTFQLKWRMNWPGNPSNKRKFVERGAVTVVVIYIFFKKFFIWWVHIRIFR